MIQLIDDEGPVYVRATEIICISSCGDGKHTKIMLSSGEYMLVKDTPETIIGLM